MAEVNREKPYPKFPLNWHKAGYWFKRIDGKVYYFGPRWGSPTEALDDYLTRRARPDASRNAFVDSTGVLTIQALCNYFLEAKERQKESGELSQRSWNDDFEICRKLVDLLGAKTGLELAYESQSQSEELRNAACAGERSDAPQESKSSQLRHDPSRLPLATGSRHLESP